MDVVAKIMQYEGDGFDEPEELYEFFQYLVDSGMAWTLQGSYGRMAMDLIRAGKIHAAPGYFERAHREAKCEH